LPGLSFESLESSSKFLVEFAGGVRDVDAARDTALAVFDALDDARGLAAFGAVGRLGCVHDLLAVTCFCDLGHLSVFLLLRVVSAHIRSADGFNDAVVAGLGVQRDLREASGTRSIQFTALVSDGWSLRRRVCGGPFMKLPLRLAQRFRLGSRGGATAEK